MEQDINKALLELERALKVAQSAGYETLDQDSDEFTLPDYIYLYA